MVGFQPGQPYRRRLRALLVDLATGALTDAVVSVTDGAVVSQRIVDPVIEGQFPILDGDFARANEIVHADDGWLAAMARRGLGDAAKVMACPLTAGAYDLPGEEGRRPWPWSSRSSASLQRPPGHDGRRHGQRR